VACPVDLPLPTVVGDASIVVTIRELSTFPSEPVVGRLIWKGWKSDGEWSLGRLSDDSGWGFRLGRLCAGDISDDGSRVSIDLAAGAPHEWIADLVTTWILALRFAVLGRWSFHGSCVAATADEALAFLGPSGSGKSTLAAAACAAGASLLADDMLVGHVGGPTVIVEQTSSVLKLRRGVRHLSDTMDFAARSEALDGRLRVDLESVVRQAPLRTIFFVNRTSEIASFRPLAPPEVAAHLMANSKLVNWIDESYREAEFDAACGIASAVRGFEISPPNFEIDHSTAALDRFLDSCLQC
jgi:hypothetical protein